MARRLLIASMLLVILLLVACTGPTDVEPGFVAATPTVTVQSQTTNAEETQLIQLDNCDGKADLTRTEERAQSIEAEISAEVAAQIGASAQVVYGNVQAAVGAALKYGNARGTAIQLVAPPGSRMEYQLIWIGNEEVGVVQNILNSDVPIAFRSFSATDVRIKSQYDLGCTITATPSSGAATAPVLATVSTTPMTVDSCMLPSELAQQKGWTAFEMVDEYGGYRVQLDQPDQLPSLWEANGARRITQLDPDRSMAAGTWIIYVPYNCRHIIDIQPPPCIHPEELARQNGWTVRGLVDEYGGYEVVLAGDSELPRLWEANGPEQIRQLDIDRSMTAGVWTIYTPYSCRELFDFKK